MKSTSLSPILIALPRFVNVLDNNGSNTASIVSSIFSSKTVFPLVIAFSISSKYDFWVGRKTTTFLPYFCRIHLTPCLHWSKAKTESLNVHYSRSDSIAYNCGSIRSGQRVAFVNITAFSVDIRSFGKPSLCHVAICASSHSKCIKSTPSVCGISGCKEM